MNSTISHDSYVLAFEILLALALAGFLFLRKKKDRDPSVQNVLRIELKLTTEFTPAEVRTQLGRPSQLVIHRYHGEPAEELFEIEALGIYELLPALHTTIIAFTAEKRGRFPLIIGGEKKAGTLVVE
jgi:hypothetical protein